MQVTEGPHAGKLALIDFGLVSELPASDREAMVSATIHLGNRDWNALITDFIALGFLPANSDRGLIIPVMEKVLSPYLRGGGAKAFNFQARSCCCTSACITECCDLKFGVCSIALPLMQNREVCVCTHIVVASEMSTFCTCHRISWPGM